MYTITLSYCGSCWSSRGGNKLPSRHNRDILDSLNITSGIPPNSSEFSSTLSTFSLLHWASAAGNTLILLQFKFNSTPLKTSRPSGRDSMELDERSAKSRWTSWRRNRGKCLSLLWEMTTFLRDFMLTRESGREERRLWSKLRVSSFFRLPSSSGRWAGVETRQTIISPQYYMYT